MIDLSSARWIKICFVLILCLAIGFIAGCKPIPSIPEKDGISATEMKVGVPETEVVIAPSVTPSPLPAPDVLADVLSVQISGTENTFQFAVEISSPDIGCDQYADWWEVLTEDGTLIYRRILAHSHRDEQPFVRSGRPININNLTVVIIRAHMYPTGYGGIAMKGSVESGFKRTDIAADFAAHTETESPLPDGCAF